MICLDCGCYVPPEKLKPCKAVYKNKYPDGVPICDKCCAVCREVLGMGGKKGCEYIEKISFNQHKPEMV